MKERSESRAVADDRLFLRSWEAKEQTRGAAKLESEFSVTADRIGYSREHTREVTTRLRQRTTADVVAEFGFPSERGRKARVPQRGRYGPKDITGVTKRS